MIRSRRAPPEFLVEFLMPGGRMQAVTRFEMLGGFAVLQGMRTIRRFATRNASLLLARLARDPRHPCPREVLIEMLWPEAPPEVGRHRLRQALTSLRHQLEPPGIPRGGILVATRQEVGLRHEVVSTDVADFSEASRSARAASGAAGERVTLARAVRLYKGDLLPGFYADWIEADRERLHLEYLRAASRLAELDRRAGADGDAADLLLHIVAANADEPGHAVLSRFRNLMDRIHADPERYRELERLLKRSLGGPSAARRGVSAREREPIGTRPAEEERNEPAPSCPLPLYTDSFHGRAGELDRIASWLDGKTRPPILCLLGNGGVGKTRLAAHAAEAALLRRAGRNVWFAPLAGLTKVEEIPRALARVAGFPLMPGVDAVDAIVQALSSILIDSPAPGLLILDNLEHLVEGGRRIIARLHRDVPALAILITSRRRLRIRGESTMVLKPLPLPGEPDVSPVRLLASPSVLLFQDRMQMLRPDFAVTARNADAVRRLCRRLEGLPLAIELAAGWGRTHAPARMLIDLEDRGERLVARRCGEDERHGSLHSTIAWSVDLLPARLRELLAILAIFRGGFAIQTLRAVVPQRFRMDLTRSIRQLEDHSLVFRESGDLTAHARWTMAESVRLHAEETLPIEDAETLRHRHALAMLQIAEEARAGIETTDQLGAIRSVDREWENIRGAATWAARSPDRSLALRLAVAAWRFWELRNEYDEARGWLEQALAHKSLAFDKTVRGWIGLGVLTCYTTEFDRAAAFLDRAVSAALATTPVDSAIAAEALNARALVAWNVKSIEAAETWYGEALRHATAAGDAATRRDSLVGSAKLAVQRGDMAAALRLQAQALREARKAGAPWGVLSVLLDRGMTAYFAGAIPEAETDLKASLDLCEKIGDRYSSIRALWGLSGVALRKRRTGAAREHLRRCLRETLEIGHRLNLAYCLEGFASLQAATGRHAEAARLLGTAAAVRGNLGFEARLPHEQRVHARLRESVRSRLGPAEFDRRFARGRTEDPQAIARALL